ncbi:MAG: DUF4340 domain-containing protein [Clostridia bacterium]|nr:DUF4340 domain-containing protein [Clostridia bacterium]
MSKNPEEKDTNLSATSETDFEESTIFSAPVEHKDTKKGSKMLRNGLLTTLLLLFVVGLAAIIWIFVPEMEGEVTSSAPQIDTTPLWSIKNTNLDAVTIIKGDEKIEFLSVEIESATSSASAEYEWQIKGADHTLISEEKIQTVISMVSYLEYLRIMDNKDADYGFSTPNYKIEIKSKDGNDDKTLLVGTKTADGSGVYLTVEGQDTVYLAEPDFISYLKTDPLYFADTTGLPAFSKESDYTGEYFTEGVLTNFDKIEIEGTSLSEKLTFKKNTGILDFGSYLITSPANRYANTESVSGLYNAFTSGIAGTGVYSFENTAAQQKLYGLNNPDFVATIYAGNETRTFKVKKQNDDNYALIGDGLRVILKVSPESLPFATYSVNDFYSNFMFIESLTEAKTITITEGDKSHKFTIITEKVENAEGKMENQIKAIKANGKEIDATNFQNYYEKLLWISAVEFSFIDTSNMEADLTIHITHNDGTKDTVIKYYQKSDMRYQMEVNGEKMGVISSSSFKNIFKYADNVANGKPYNS